MGRKAFTNPHIHSHTPDHHSPNPLSPGYIAQSFERKLRHKVSDMACGHTLTHTQNARLPMCRMASFNLISCFDRHNNANTARCVLICRAHIFIFQLSARHAHQFRLPLAAAMQIIICGASPPPLLALMLHSARSHGRQIVTAISTTSTQPHQT